MIKILINPFYEKTNVITSGTDLSFYEFIHTNVFGINKENEFNLLKLILNEKKQKDLWKLIKTSNLRYELRFNYNLKLNGKKLYNL